MTTNTQGTSILLAAEIERIEADLKLANADVTLLERLKSATDRVARLTGELEKAIKARDKALIVDAKAHDERRFAGISNVRISEATTSGENVVRSNFTIEFNRPVWDGRSTRDKQHSSDGFGSLPPEVLDYIIERRPELIPAKIMALAPDRPRDAFRRYFGSIRRGYVAA